MKYAPEIMELMSTFPKRSFRVMELVRYATAGRPMPARERAAARRAVHRVLDILVNNGTVLITDRAVTNGGFALYSMPHGAVVNPGHNLKTRSLS